MARFPRRVAGLVLFLVILGNLWYLYHSSNWLGKNPATLAESGTPVPDTYKSKDGLDADSAAATAALSKENSKGDTADASTSAEDTHGFASYEQGMEVIKKTLDTISEILPGVKKLDTYIRDIKGDTELSQSGELPATSFVLGQYLQISDEEVAALTKSHAKMMSHLPDHVVPNSFKGRGIVMTGGGKYFPMVLTAIRWLRDMGNSMPIEVFMADDSEYEKHICEGLFAKLNVECRVVREIYGEQLSRKLESKYALKPLAILASKFDDIYFMDADSYPLVDLNKIFDWDQYVETGLILNADYWPRYISPKFYEIVDRPLGDRARGFSDSDALLQSDRKNAVPGKSTESGQVFIKKSGHIKSLLLAMYYNLFGPDVYFPLLMQGGHGEGDKDTYAAAAIICNESYYQTQRRPVTLGQHLDDGSYKGFAMAQPDPINDYRIFEEKQKLKDKFFALHANSIKSNPKYMLQGYTEKQRGSPPLRQQRFFGNMANVIYEMIDEEDIEARLFQAMTHVACEWAVQDKFVPRDWDGEDPQRFCTIMTKHIQWLKENPDVDAPADAKFWIDLE